MCPSRRPGLFQPGSAEGRGCTVALHAVGGSAQRGLTQRQFELGMAQPTGQALAGVQALQWLVGVTGPRLCTAAAQRSRHHRACTRRSANRLYKVSGHATGMCWTTRAKFHGAGQGQGAWNTST
jgi:hypothetical protein